jgi:uncharacterized protein YjbI with pentapeptide repeats
VLRLANENQFAILKKGVEVWNTWREENPYTSIDLEGITFVNSNLAGVNLSGANLSSQD